jgi:hypothetical protein
MKTGRTDLDAIIKVASIPANEPTFILRGQNRTAAETVRHWAELEKAQGSPIAVVEQGLQQADALEAWPVKRALNADHLSEAQARQLSYQHSRRVWAHGRVLDEAHAFALTAEIIETLVDMGDRGIDPTSRPNCGNALVAMAREVKALRAKLNG